MTVDADQLFALLPAVYGTRDAAAGGALQSLFAVMAAQGAIVEENIQQLYDDQFIETCSPWVIPYIGDLIGYNSIYQVSSASTDSRAEVANTIGYRRRKGTLIALEQLSADVSGRAAVVVEEFRRLITTESMRAVDPDRQATVDVRTLPAPYVPDSPFDEQHHTIDVRRIAPRFRALTTPDAAPLDVALHGGGRFNIPDIAIHLWRWQSWPITNAPAFPLGNGRYVFSPLGADMLLFSQPRPAESFSALADRSSTPAPIARRELLEFYDSSIVLTEDGQPVDSSRICCANLGDRPDGSWCTVPAGKIAVDAELGRVKYADDVARPRSLELTYWYGFPAPIGGGPYDRSAALSQLDLGGANLFAVVGTTDYPTLESAVAAWNALAPGASGVIVLPGYASMTVDLTGAAAITLPAGSNLAIAAGGPDPSGGREVTWSASRVTLTGDIEVSGVAAAGSSISGADPPAGQLLINGVWIAGQLSVTGAASTLQLADSTLVPGLGLLPDGEPMFPGDPSIVVVAGATVVLSRTICGPIAADRSATTRVCASILDATAPTYVAYAGTDLASAGGDLQVEDTTVVGKVSTRTITLASNTIFHAQLAVQDPWPAAVYASRRQSGCVRFCVLPYDSITPRRYNCLPPDAASEASLMPQFVSLRYGDPGYVLLSGDCPVAIWTGADNGSQLGAYLQIQETEAVTNVQLRAPEYTPALLESGVFIHPARSVARPRPAIGPYGYGQPVGPELPGIGAELI